MDVIAHPLMQALLGVIAVLVYAWHIRRHPWMPCLKCGGSGKTRALTFDPFGACGRCGGSGKRLRFACWLLGYNRETGAKR